MPPHYFDIPVILGTRSDMPRAIMDSRHGKHLNNGVWGTNGNLTFDLRRGSLMVGIWRE